MRPGLDEKQYVKALQEVFSDLTKRFDLDDWRTVRTPYYWLADKMQEGEALVHKIRLIEYYIKHGVPLN